MQDREPQTQTQAAQVDAEVTLPPTQNAPTSFHDRTPSVSNTNADDDRVQQHRQALNNLMAALNQSGGTKPEQTGTADSLAVQDSHMSNTQVLPGSDNHFVANNNPATPPPLQSDLTTLQPLLNGITAFPDFPSMPFDDNMLIPPPNPYDSQDLSSMTQPFPEMATPAAPRAVPRKIGAFAKLNFDDGHYYMSTYQIELGRDAIAYQDALRREKEEKDGLQLQAQSSSGRMSRHSDRIKRGVDSQLQGSVVSEAGGFAGLDDMPAVVPGAPENEYHPPTHPSHSSQLSQSDLVNPNDLALSRAFDYAKRGDEVAAYENEGATAVADNEQPAPVTAEHMPDPGICPLIPIHAMTDSDIPELTTHKMISRRHAKITWSATDESFVIIAMGRNGLFVDGTYYQQKVRRLIGHGSVIQIAGIEIRFELPNLDHPELGNDHSLPDYDGHSPERPGSITPISTVATPEETTPVPKLSLKVQGKRPERTTTPQPTQPGPLLGPDGQPIVRKRGPGRPPKDGIMSTRERKEREKAAKAAELKAANGGTTPPPSMNRTKPFKPPTPQEMARFDAARQEKKPYVTTNVGVKRKHEDGTVVQSIEGGEEIVQSDSERQPIKKARQSKSPSPDYPTLEQLTEEQLARPSEPYARLIYDILIDIYPKALPLKQIYRAIKIKFPFFVHKVESDGWQSSVRHNLNQEWNKLFEKGEKEGKGFAWKAIPGALQPAAERRKAAQAAAASKPKPQQQKQNQQNFGNQSWPNGYPTQPNGMPWPPGQGPQGARGYQKAQPQQPVALPAPGASNMPCTFDGFLAIRRFEQVMYEHAKKIPGSNGLERLTMVFNSVKARLLHGAPASTCPGYEGKEEKTIMNQVKGIIERFRNPAFQGYQIKPLSRGQSPAVNATTARSSVSGPAGPRPQSSGQMQPSPYPAQGPPRQPSTPLANSANAMSQRPQNPPPGPMQYPPPSAPNAQQRPDTPNANGGAPPQSQPHQQQRPNMPTGNGGQVPQMQRQPSNGSIPQSNTPPVGNMQRQPGTPTMQQHSPAFSAAQANGQPQRPPSRNGQQQFQPMPNQQGHQHAYPPEPGQQQQHQQAQRPPPPMQQHQQQQGPPQQPVQQQPQRPPSQPFQQPQQSGPSQQAPPQRQPVPPQQQQQQQQGAVQRPGQNGSPVLQQGYAPPVGQVQQQRSQSHGQQPSHTNPGPPGAPSKAPDVTMTGVPPPQPTQFQTVGQAATAANGSSGKLVPGAVGAVNGNTLQAGSPSSSMTCPNDNGNANGNEQLQQEVGKVDGSGDVQMTAAPPLDARAS